ncbi:unnamed protein product [Arctia plantaginis]|uniref:Ketosynthase family 3 (KS3) domain-containing protein n=1 Tax=Arctia plantaginis TaxID=874455 RepID=A0A8S1B2W2_ARCPL|nr:unnamed protein product [Arctia plantaginis]
MAPSDSNNETLNGVPNSLHGDEVVISGISGIFPNSDSVVEFMNNLYNKVDMVTNEEPKWIRNDPDIPKHVGKIKGMDKFDSQFFGVTYHLACVLEPMGRKLLEHTYGAIFDSGTSPQSIRGKKVGVFIGSSFTDNSNLSFFAIKKRNDFVVNGGSKSMLANRISYWIDGKGPSYTLDHSDTSSTACLEVAYQSIKSGECDAAIVGGCNYILHPTLSLNMRRCGLLCLDGKTKCFDKNADGYVRADAVNVIFLQRARDAHRVYAEIYHVKGSYKMKPDAHFLATREPKDIEEFLREVYSRIDVDPNKVEYVEADGAATAKADESELKAISNIFAKDGSVKVGSVKSNMGNSEPASGICSITKLCLAYHKGKLPANLHYNDPQDHIPAIRNGRIQVVSEHTGFDREFTAVNNFSYTGAQYHVVLKGHYKQKNLQKYKCNIPYLVLASGRQETCVQKIIDMVKSHPIDPEEIGLLHKVFEHEIRSHTGRGYMLLDTDVQQNTVCLSESLEYYPGIKRPLWFVFSGMGSQWPTMGADLMRIPSFAASIYKCHKVLEPKGVDLIKIMTDPDKSIFENDISNAFVGISAMQLAFTDLMKKMGIVPDSIIGHSLGEIGCAYHDDTFTAEEMILATYCRSQAIKENLQIEGLMVAVGLGYKQMLDICPPEIDIACHNSSESTTLSGPADIMRKFMKDLNDRGIFAREVPSGGIAYHSRYIAHCGSEFLRRLNKIIKNPKKRSSKWISTSVPQERWNEPAAMYSSAEYHSNNMLNPVLFEEMTNLIPDNAVVVEIAPHGLLQAILKRSHKNCTHIPLTKRGSPNGVQFFLEAIGKIYEAGINPKVDVLYPKIEFPVSTETTLLSHYIEWEHSEPWPEFSFLEKDEIKTTASRNFVMSIHDDDYKFLEGYARDGVNVLPESAILVLVWETLSMHIGVKYQSQSVVFKDIQFHGEVTINPDIPFKLSIAISRGNNNFEVIQGDTQIASGVVSTVKVLKFYQDVEKSKKEINFEEEFILLDLDDVYKILESRGYSYKGKCKGIHQSNLDLNAAYIEWNKDWVTFLESLIQLNIVAHDYNGISVPKFIRKLRISVLEQDISKTEEVNGVNCLYAEFNKNSGITRCAGVEIDNLRFTDKPLVERQPDVLLSRSFYPHYSMNKVDIKTALHINLQIVAENITMNEIRVTQIVTSNNNINCIIKEISQNIPNVNINVVSELNVSEDYEALLSRNMDTQKANVFILENLLDNEIKLKNLRNIPNDCFILALETGVPKIQGLAKQHFDVASAMSDGKQIIMLLRRQNFKDVTYVRVNCDNKLDWVSRVYDELNKTKRVVLLSERQPYCGALGLVRKLRLEGEDRVALVSIGDFNAPAFHPEHGLFKEQLEKSLAVNVLQKGEWGGFYYMPVSTRTKLRNATLTSTAPGDLDSLTWTEAPTVPSSKHLVQVSYGGISLRDVKKALSIHNTEEMSFGMDFSGIDSDGERVMGIIPSGTLSSTIEADPNLIWPVPEHWTLQDAATVPLPYAMAYYCMSILGLLFKDQTVLVTGGAGALGQAIISLCLSIGCTIYVTVSNEYKKKMLLSIFPQLDENKIGQSRNDSFLNLIKTQTKGNGCDIVINSASGPLRELAMKCVGCQGYFLDLSSHDMSENKNIGMSFLTEDRSYKAVDFSNIFRPENANNKQVIQSMLSEGIARGIVKPISRVEYLPTATSRAFRLLSSSKHVGKVLIKMRSPEIMSQGLEVIPRMNYCSKGVYIVICDDNGLAIELATRLIKRGVRKIILHMQSKVSGYLQTKLVSWQKYGVSIKISSNNIQTEDGCTKLVKEAARIGSVKGIFIVQVPENDENAHDFVQKFNKAIAVINLDLVSRNYCNELSHFVVLTTSSRHASEEFAMSVSENVCQARSVLGAPALFIRAEGLIGNKTENRNSKQTLSEFFNAMETSLKLNYKNVVSLNLNKAPTSEYLDKLQKILGVVKLENIDNKMVADLYLNENNLEELRTLIRNVHQISYPIEKIQRLTVECLKSLGTQTTTNVVREGLGVFYTNIDDEEEHMATSHPIVPMVTILNNGTDTDLDPSDTYIVLIPGFEGRHQTLETIAERLKVQAVAVQLACDIEGNNIPEMAATVRKFMSTKFETKSKFYLLGYSFGVNIALELAALLEKEGHVGIVYCLDSSPDVLKIQLKTYLGDVSDSMLQNTILEHMYTLMTGNEIRTITHELEKAMSWSDKVDICMKNMIGLVNYSNQYKRSILESAYQRILLAKEYEPDLKLESQLVLMKGVSHPKADNLARDYRLSKYTKKPVKVFQLKSDHPSAPYDCQVSNIVNKLLDKNLLEDFKKKNLCDSYRVE